MASIFDFFIPSRRDKLTGIIAEDVTKSVVSHVNKALETSQDLAKAQQGGYVSALPTGGVKRYQFDQNLVNGGMQARKKPGSNISFETLRRFSISHEVSRACINFRKRQITGLDWNIVTAEEDQTVVNDQQVKELKQFFKNLGGRGIGYRKFMNRLIEDLMVLDAVALEKQRNRGYSLINLIPIDAATIRLRVDETGALPAPPEPAYIQVIRGQQVAKLTADEMIYDMMNPRNDTPYGLAPLESLMIIVTSSLKSGMYNLAYLTDGNMPEGFYSMPENWSPQQIKDFQEYFDALMAGDETMTRRLKFMPPGKYEPTKKPEDMAFAEFNDWLMKITCALYEVNPQDIGFSPKGGLGGKGFADVQAEVSKDKGLQPLANFIEEMFTSVIQDDFGFANLRFEFKGLQAKDAKAEAETNEILIRSGQRTIDELRTDEGLDALPDGAGEKPIFAGQITYLGEVPEVETQTEQENEDKDQPAAPPEDNELEDAQKRHVDLVSEMRTFRKYAVGRAKTGKKLRKFESKVLPEDVVAEMNDRLAKAQGVSEVRGVFDEYMQDYQVRFLDDVQTLRQKLNKVL